MTTALRVSVTGAPPVLVESLATALDTWALESERPWYVAAGGRRRTMSPDVVVVVDLTTGVPTEIERARAAHPDAGLLWIAGQPDGRAVADAVARGCTCVVTQSCRIEEVAVGIEQASTGQSWTTPELVGPLMDHIRKGPQELNDQLSVRELEVLALLAIGRSTTSISDELFISTHTTRNHIRRIMRKLEAHSRVEAIAIGRSKGLIPTG